VKAACGVKAACEVRARISDVLTSKDSGREPQQCMYGRAIGPDAHFLIFGTVQFV
jgi:hypothetical protein